MEKELKPEMTSKDFREGPAGEAEKQRRLLHLKVGEEGDVVITQWRNAGRAR